MIVFTYLFIIICLLTSLFHLSLIFGAPLGEYTMSGKFKGKLPIKMRIASFFQIIVLAIFAIIALSKSKIAFTYIFDLSQIAIWLIFIFFILGTILNIISPSKKERLIMIPINIIALISSFIIAIS